MMMIHNCLPEVKVSVDETRYTDTEKDRQRDRGGGGGNSSYINDTSCGCSGKKKVLCPAAPEEVCGLNKRMNGAPFIAVSFLFSVNCI